MEFKLKRPRGITIARYTLWGATILAYVLIRRMLFPWLSWYLPAFLFALLPALVVETEFLSCIQYFKFGVRKSKITTLLCGLRLFCTAIVILLGFLGWVSLMATLFGCPFNAEIPFCFGFAILLWGISKVLDSIWAILYYRHYETEKSVKAALLLAGKFIFSILVCYLGFFAMLIYAFMTSPR